MARHSSFELFAYGGNVTVVKASADVDHGAGLGAMARIPTDAGYAAGAELHERDHDDARDHGVATEQALQRAPDAGLSGLAAPGVTAHRRRGPRARASVP